MEGRPTPYAELVRMSDAELVALARERFRSGNPGIQTARMCIALLYERRRDLVRACCAAKAAPGDVDDLEQQVYVRFVRAAYHQTAEMMNPAGLLVKMARNVVASHHAKRAADPLDAGEPPEIEIHESGYDELEVSEAVEELLRVLDDRQRAVVIGKVFDKISAAEIGAKLGIKPGHVDVIFFHALRKMRAVAER